MRCSGNETTAPCLTTVQGQWDALFFNEAATGLIGLFPAVGKVLPLSAFWARCPMLGGGQQLVVLRKTSLWLLLAWVSSGQQAESGADNRL